MHKRFCLEIRPYGNYCPHLCAFCYQSGGKNVSAPMSVNTAVTALEHIIEYMSMHLMSELKLVFHGGEPAHDGGKLIFKIFDNASKLLKQTDINVRYLCHTSGFSKININEFFHRNILVCVNRHIPDTMQEDQILSFKNNTEALFDLGILNKQIIVLTRKTLCHVDECLNAINEFNLPTKLQPQFPSSPACAKSEEIPDIKDIIDFLTSLLLKASNRKINLNNVEFINRLLVSSKKNNGMIGCRHSTECPFAAGILKSATVDADGTIYACNRFAGIKAFPLGTTNVSRKQFFYSIEEAIENIKTKYGYRTEEAQESCKSCSLFLEKACPGTGGCPFFAYIWNSQNIDPYCLVDNLLHKAFFNI